MGERLAWKLKASPAATIFSPLNRAPFDAQEENASLRSMPNSKGQLSLPARPATQGFAVAGPSAILRERRCRGGLEESVILQSSPKNVVFSLSPGGNGAATDGKAWAAATAAAESEAAVDGRRELSLKQLHVRFLTKQIIA